MKKIRPWLWLLLLAPLGFGAFRLRFDVEILNLLPPHLPVVEGLKLYQQNFANARELITTVEAPTAEGAENGARALAELLRRETSLVAEVVWRPAWQENPAQATELLAALWLNQPPPEVAALTNRLTITNLPNVLAEARERIATSLSPEDFVRGGYDPYGLTRLPESATDGAPTTAGEEMFASGDGAFRLVFIHAAPDLSGYRACRAWMAGIQRLIALAQADGRLESNLTFQHTGRPAFVAEISSTMENDMAGSAGGTLATIGLLFWLTHRRLRPLLWLVCMLLVILGATTALGGLFLGTINVVSLGFASILLGLSEDFGIVIYQEARSHPELGPAALRREVAPGIFWSAVTTAGAFLTLNLSSLPGLRQLGSMVAIGIMLGAGLMLFMYLPPLLRMRRPRDRAGTAGVSDERLLLFATRRILPPTAVWMISGLLLGGAALVLWGHRPQFDHSPDVLQPRNSAALAALEAIKAHLGRQQDPLWVLISGRDETEVAHRLDQAGAVLNHSAANGLIQGFTLPTALWPRPENQRANREALAALARGRAAFRRAALAGGFGPEAMDATDRILETWAEAAKNSGVFWPTNPASRWLTSKMAARTTNGFLALGYIQQTTNNAATRQFAAQWPAKLKDQGVILSGWELLGTTVFDMVIEEMPKIIIPIFALVIVSLWLAFRNITDVCLSVFTLAFSLVLLWALMGLLGWDWNMLNLMALPLLLGMGVDFSIHVQLTLRRHPGDLLAVRRSVGRALLLAGATTVAGFGSLAFSTNGGMASLGKICAVGITMALLVAVYLLPVWWEFCHSFGKKES